MIYANNPELLQWLASCQEVIRKHFEENFPSLDVPTLELQPGSKFIRVVRKDRRTDVNGYCWAFVACVDNNTKALGDVKRGDIMKPASFKIPAKHARGNLFDDNKGMKEITAYGPNYIR